MTMFSQRIVSISQLITIFLIGLSLVGTTLGEPDQRPVPRGTASVKFGMVNGEQEMGATSGTRNISGVYPHLTTYSQSRKDGKFFKDGHEECGIGALIPWADRLWMITYGPHKPRGSDHKLYSIDKELNMTIHAESVGGTPAARMIHEESQQLFLGHYAIDKAGKVRAIDPGKASPSSAPLWVNPIRDLCRVAPPR